MPLKTYRSLLSARGKHSGLEILLTMYVGRQEHKTSGFHTHRRRREVGGIGRDFGRRRGRTTSQKMAMVGSYE